MKVYFPVEKTSSIRPREYTVKYNLAFNDNKEIIQ